VCGVRLGSGQMLRCDVDATSRAPLSVGSRVNVIPRVESVVAFLNR
jgi:hypothetical protein